MPEIVVHALAVFTSFFAIMNPLANTPIFLGIVGDISRKEKKKIAGTACITAFLIVVSFIVLGRLIFELFGITIAAFRITGGILIFYIGFEMLMSQKSKVHNYDHEISEGIAISPLAIPILAGPGTIVTAMTQASEGGIAHIAVVVVVFAVMIWLTYLAFSLSDVIVKRVGK